MTKELKSILEYYEIKNKNNRCLFGYLYTLTFTIKGFESYIYIYIYIYFFLILTFRLLSFHFHLHNVCLIVIK